MAITNFLNMELFTREDREFYNSWIDIVALVLDVPIVGICMLIDDRQELIAHKGFSKKPFFSSGDDFFNFTLKQSNCLIVRDTILDPRFRDSYLVENSPYIYSYMGISLSNNKLGKIGTFFIADNELRDFSQDVLNHFQVFSKQLESIISDKIDKEFLFKKERFHMRSLKHFINDLKSPMSIIKVSLDMMRSAEQKGEISPKLVSRCQKNLRKTLLTIDEFFKTDSFDIECDKNRFEYFELQTFIRTTVGELQYLIGENQQVINQVETKEVYSDLKLVRRIIDNLISNAVKYGGSSNIIIKSRTIDKAVEISICDEGEGIDDKSKDQIFSFEHKNGGSVLLNHGIGLHFCKVSAERLGGKLCVSDNSPKGAKFMLQLPL